MAPRSIAPGWGLASILAVVLAGSATAEEMSKCNSSMPDPAVHAAFYLWYGNPEHDGKWIRWNHKTVPNWNPEHGEEEHTEYQWTPPDEHYAPFRPERGLYSSRDTDVLKAQFVEMAAATIDSAMVSWWGRKDWAAKFDPGEEKHADSDELMPSVLEAAELAGMYVTFHMQPYDGRTPATFLTDLKRIIDRHGSHPAIWREGEKKLPVFWLYDVSVEHSHDDVAAWRSVLDSVRGTAYDGIFYCLWIGKKGDEAFVRDAGFDGAYTHFASIGHTYGSNPVRWPAAARALQRIGKLFVASVAPGYNDTMIRPWNTGAARFHGYGRYYDRMWAGVKDSSPHAVSITSYNNWDDGTQIESAVAYISPEGKFYNDYGMDKPTTHLDSTKVWAAGFRKMACEPHHMDHLYHWFRDIH